MWLAGLSTLGSSGLPSYRAAYSPECLSSFLSSTAIGVSCNRVSATFLEGITPHTYTVGFRKSERCMTDAVWGRARSLVGYFALQTKPNTKTP